MAMGNLSIVSSNEIMVPGVLKFKETINYSFSETMQSTTLLPGLRLCRLPNLTNENDLCIN